MLKQIAVLALITVLISTTANAASASFSWTKVLGLSEQDATEALAPVANCEGPYPTRLRITHTDAPGDSQQQTVQTIDNINWSHIYSTYYDIPFDSTHETNSTQSLKDKEVANQLNSAINRRLANGDPNPMLPSITALKCRALHFPLTITALLINHRVFNIALTVNDMPDRRDYYSCEDECAEISTVFLDFFDKLFQSQQLFEIRDFCTGNWRVTEAHPTISKAYCYIYNGYVGKDVLAEVRWAERTVEHSKSGRGVILISFTSVPAFHDAFAYLKVVAKASFEKRVNEKQEKALQLNDITNVQ